MEKNLEHIETIIRQLTDKMAELDPNHDKVVFSFRHLLIIERKFYLYLYEYFSSWNNDISEITDKINQMADKEVKKLISQNS